MRIVPVPVRSDNYACELLCFTGFDNILETFPRMTLTFYCLQDLVIDEATKTAAAVDPYDVKKGRKHPA